MVKLVASSRLVERTYIALQVVVTFIVLCRFVARGRKRNPIRWDDVWMVIAWANFTAYSGLVLKSTSMGSSQVSTTPPSAQDGVLISQVEYAAGIVFENANIASKISLLCLYRRIFITSTFRKWSVAVLSLCMAWYISSVLVTIFQCWPIHKAWVPSIDGTCINVTNFLMGYEVGNMVCDVVILCLPVRMIHTLQLSRAQKLLLSGIFLLGGFVCITSILRITYTFGVHDTADFVVNVRLWSDASVASSVVCANLPVLRPIFPRHDTLRKWYELSTRRFTSRGSSQRWRPSTREQIPGHPGSHQVNVSTGGYSVLGGASQEWKNPKRLRSPRGEDFPPNSSSAYPLQSIKVDRTVDVV